VWNDEGATHGTQMMVSLLEGLAVRGEVTIYCEGLTERAFDHLINAEHTNRCTTCAQTAKGD
jgi:hypothetical protein